jgi:RNA polymerase sigma-70 factor (ECF subfamily)
MESIVKQILSGEPEKFRDIVREYNEEFLRLAYRFTADWDEAKDVTQTTFIRTWRSLRQFNPRRSFRAWIFRIHLNNCRTSYRRSRLHRLRTTTLENVEAASNIGDQERIISPPLLRAIHALPNKQRLSFLLIELEGYSTADTAAALNCAESTVRVHLARARSALRKRLNDLGISPGD